MNALQARAWKTSQQARHQTRT